MVNRSRKGVCINRQTDMGDGGGSSGSGDKRKDIEK